jgi:hypothetical protein
LLILKIVPKSVDMQQASLPSYLPLRTQHLRDAVSVSLALHKPPQLACLVNQAEHSATCLRLIAPLIPSSMRECIKAGPWDGERWCLLVTNSAVAAKLRQLSPALAAHLRTHGQAVSELRIKVMMATQR